MPAPRYIVHQTGYERDGYILKSLLAHSSVALPLPALRRTTWHVCWIALDELRIGDEPYALDEAAVQRLAAALQTEHPIEPVLVLGPEKQLLVGHHRVAALQALGERRVLAYHGEWLDPARRAHPVLREVVAA
ncbi:MAG: ParB/RepB/Spo0J family partition protein [Ardenticatenaceae bacterium]|nr:ParB/RepB/Spo0J family partition protein [Ardenticatenaceae bacterium]HBY94969.1 hypothetical protein [Chloroflexota bacterium]